MAELTKSSYNLSQYLRSVNNFLSNNEVQQYSESRKRFMSEDNIKLIVISIIRAVKSKLNIILELNNISPIELSTIMRSIFLQNALNDNNRVAEDVYNLNKMVCKKCIDIIISSVKNYIWVQSNIDKETGYQKQQPLIDIPKSTYSSNQLYNNLVTIEKLPQGGNRSRPDDIQLFFEDRIYTPPKYPKSKLFKIK